MNWEQIKGILERILTAALMWAAGAGYIPGDQVANIVAIIVAIGAVAWGWKVNTQPALVAATAALPDVKEVVVTKDLKESVNTSPEAKVST